MQVIFRLFILYFVAFFLPEATWKYGQYIRLKNFGILNEPLYNVVVS